MPILTLFLVGCAASASADFTGSQSDGTILSDTLQLETSLQELGGSAPAGADMEEDRNLLSLFKKSPGKAEKEVGAAMKKQKGDPANAKKSSLFSGKMPKFSSKVLKSLKKVKAVANAVGFIVAVQEQLAPYKRESRTLPLPGEKNMAQTKKVKSFEESHSKQMCMTQAKALGVPPEKAPCNALYQDGHITLGLNKDAFWKENATLYGGQGLKDPLIIDCLDDSVAETYNCDDPKYSASALKKACTADVTQCPTPVRAEFRMEKPKDGKGQLNKKTGQLWSLFLKDPPEAPFFNARVFICDQAIMDSGAKAHLQNVYCDENTEIFNVYLRSSEAHMPERYRVKRADLPWLPNNLDPNTNNPKNNLHKYQVAAGIKETPDDLNKLSKLQNVNPSQILHWSQLQPIPKTGEGTAADENKWIGNIGEPKPTLPPSIDVDNGPSAQESEYGEALTSAVDATAGAKSLSLESGNALEQLQQEAKAIEQMLRD